jgi:hypothetical protein
MIYAERIRKYKSYSRDSTNKLHTFSSIKNENNRKIFNPRRKNSLFPFSINKIKTFETITPIYEEDRRKTTSQNDGMVTFADFKKDLIFAKRTSSKYGHLKETN